MNKAFVIAVAGGTGAGKTTLVRALTHRFHDPTVIDLDSYYLDRTSMTLEERSHLNYDEPFAVDFDLLRSHLDKLASGKMVLKPRYSFETHTRTGTELLHPSSVVVVEGLFALCWEELRALCDLKVFVDAPADLRLLRRIQRDLEERGRTVGSVLAQYLNTIRPMHERYVEPTRQHADLVVGNEGSVEECVTKISAAIQAIPRQRI